MARVAVILPGLVGPALEILNLRGQVRRMPALPQVAAPEALWLGLPPREAGLQDGPLIVAALGAEPPERSLAFHLSVAGVEDGRLVAVPPPTERESAAIAALLPKLNTKRLTALPGEGVDHALVLEGLGDLGITSLSEATGKELVSVLPEGDFEPALRRYIDDSVNMLSELEANRRRIDEGILPLNILWPWGPGVPRRLPNLALRRGVAVAVESASLRLQGLAKLVGYCHETRYRDGMETKWERLVQAAQERTPATLLVSSAFLHLGEEETEWLLQEIDRRLLSPLTNEELLLVLPGDEGGLVLESGSGTAVPLRTEVVSDPSVESIQLWRAIDTWFS